MQEFEQEIARETVIVIRGVLRLTPRAFRSAIRLALKAAKTGVKTVGAIASLPWAVKQGLDGYKNAEHHGKQTVTQLARQNKGLQSIEVNDKNIGSFNRVAKKYGIDFAPYKVKGEKKYLVFFKGPDAAAMTAAFKEYTAKEERKASRPSLRKRLEKIKNSLETPVHDRASRQEPTR